MIVSTGAPASTMAMKASRGAFARVVRIGRRGWRAIIEAQWRLLAAQLLVWRTPIGELIAERATAGPVTASAMTPQQWQTAVQAAAAVRRAAERGIFRPRCLVRSVALTRMLDARGIRGSAIGIGVRVNDGGFAAHAWVELGGRMLGELPQHTRSFVRIAAVRIV